MDKKEQQLVFITALKSQDISIHMLNDFLNESYDEEIHGIPADYFYPFVKQQVSKAVQVTKELSETTSDDLIKDMQGILLPIGQNLDIYV